MTSSAGPTDSQPPLPKSRRHRRLLFSLAVVAVVGAGAALIVNAPSRPSPGPASTISPQSTDTTSTQDCVVAYYFHTTKRCPSCRKIEAYSQLAVETGFPGDLASGRLQWRVVNIEEKGNEHFINDYQLYTKSLVLSEIRSGREVRWKNLARVWELLGDEPSFVAYVQKETHAFVDEMP